MHTCSINQQHLIRCRMQRQSPTEQFNRSSVAFAKPKRLSWCLSIFLFIFFSFTPSCDYMSWVGSYHHDLQEVRLLQPHQHAHSASGLTIHTPHQSPLPKPHQSLCHCYHSLPHSQSELWHGDAKMMNGFFSTGNDSWRDTLPSLISKLIFHSPSSCHGHRALPWPNSPFLPDLYQDVGSFSYLPSFYSWLLDGLLCGWAVYKAHIPLQGGSSVSWCK